MSSAPIPKQINISHALQSTKIQQIRQDIKDWQQMKDLTPEQNLEIENYINSLENAFMLFTKDNEHVEKRMEGVTVADVQLYTGLKKMYIDYLNELIDIKRLKNSQDIVNSANNNDPVQFIIQELPYLEPLDRKKFIENLLSNNNGGLSLIKKDQQIIDGIKNLCLLDSTLIDNLETYLNFLNAIGFTATEVRSILPPELFDTIDRTKQFLMQNQMQSQMNEIDINNNNSNNNANIEPLFSNNTTISSIPRRTVKKSKMPIINDKPLKFVNPTGQSIAQQPSFEQQIQTKQAPKHHIQMQQIQMQTQPIKQMQQPQQIQQMPQMQQFQQIQYLPMEVTDTNQQLSPDVPQQMLLIKDQQPLQSSTEIEPSIPKTDEIKTNQVIEPLESPVEKPVERSIVEEEPKKKISFSKYLKKGDVVSSTNGKRSLGTENIINTTDSKVTKKLKPSTVSLPSSNSNSNDSQSNDSTNNSLPSILKGSDSYTFSEMKKKKKRNIKFVEDSNLVTVFGDDLPNKGLTLSPSSLKKLLKPFKQGEPREIFVSKTFTDNVKELNINTLSKNETFKSINSDISELKYGPVKCETRVPLKFRFNFGNFNPFLDKPAKEPVNNQFEDDDSSNNSNLNNNNSNNGYNGNHSNKRQHQPLIAKAFGRNRLLLRKDRGGLPYKRVPDVVPNNYPPRPK
ncbi:hypothetical protein TBLA_0H00830 [Henningerozyma blattae CBS 6284]|uniref:Uncharacterized protein n=1 Tax=Henningerozyma blattae (strain ATCC 34711 / CBS 6284 / DSM 70876 / NBRC 10599 / NRRL Y-10934 / UCD 77-7) TaxID=1071380 RepID=I2H7M0_HENB6|nr:hypothetical protein TBLA_0H00830 [Tetrapisispora blattae CBS 6284]CCH62372.1 hypothetical protein TBLA_0H00830 [Tetrapisispora blattae CBS 6284]